MTHSTTEETIANVNAEDDRPAVVYGGDSYRCTPLSRAKLEERAARSMRAEDMIGLLADAIDYEFLEIVLGCRGRKVPKDVHL